MIEIGRLCDKALSNDDLPLVIDEHQKLHSGGHERDRGMWSERALACDAEWQTHHAHPEPGLARGRVKHRALARYFPREGPKLIGIESRRRNDQEADGR